jgi:hypothetical protein
MNVFHTHASIIEDYSSYIRSFISIADPDIRQVVDRELSTGKLWPEPLLQFNPSFEMFGGLENLILQTMELLEQADYLKSFPARSEQHEEVKIYRLRLEKVLWKAGDGVTVKADFIKRRTYKKQRPEPNLFFKTIYRRDFSTMKRLRSEDHTGQLNNKTRLEREERFRADWFTDEGKRVADQQKIRAESISVLFCSPTMELGVDIGSLSVVHMRNAPPNPSCYAKQ